VTGSINVVGTRTRAGVRRYRFSDEFLFDLVVGLGLILRGPSKCSKDQNNDKNAEADSHNG
jgi:hypothetical protein